MYVTVPQVLAHRQDYEKLRDRALRAFYNLSSKDRRGRAWARHVLAELIAIGIIDYYLNHRRVALLVFRSSEPLVIEVGGVM